MVQILQIIFSSIGSLGLIVFLILFFREARRHHKESYAYRISRDKDAETIKSLTKEREELKEEITNKLSSLTSKEEERQNLLINILQKMEEKEKTREDDLMNWLEFKAKRWQEQIDSRVNERISRFQKEISTMNERIANLEEKLKLRNE